MTRYSKLTHLIKLSHFWSVSEALWILKTYQCERDEICWRNHWGLAYELECVKDKFYRATLVTTRFFGGPDGNREYMGPFSMFVVDRVLARWRKDKTDWFWLLHFTRGTTRHIKAQLEQFKPDSLKQLYLPGFRDNSDRHQEPSFDGYEGAERIIDYVQVGGNMYPILESGRQGHVVQQVGHKLPRHLVKPPAGSDNGAVHRWSSSGKLTDAKSLASSSTEPPKFFVATR